MKNIVHSRIWDNNWHDCMTFEEDSLFLTTQPKQQKKYVDVYYDFVDSCGQKYGYAIKSCMTSVGFKITFDFEYNIICEPDYQLLKTISLASTNCYISYEKAQKIAVENSNPKSRKTWTNYLINDISNNIVFWWIERETGFRKCNVEKFKIDARTGKVLERAEYILQKNFFEALWNNIGKVP
jgi:uncharacterized membrane protein YkoI